jgi:hypothetical protein
MYIRKLELWVEKPIDPTRVTVDVTLRFDVYNDEDNYPRSVQFYLYWFNSKGNDLPQYGHHDYQWFRVPAGSILVKTRAHRNDPLYALFDTLPVKGAPHPAIAARTPD